VDGDLEDGAEEPAGDEHRSQQLVGSGGGKIHWSARRKNGRQMNRKIGRNEEGLKTDGAERFEND
jgi:hypothetical protein